MNRHFIVFATPMAWQVLCLQMAFALLTGGCTRVSADQTPVAPARKPIELLPIEVGHITSGKQADLLSVSGVLVPHQQHTVKARMAGLVMSVRFQEGDSVPAGAIVATIDSGDAQAVVAERRALVASAEAELAIARKQNESQLKLLEAGFVSKSAFEIAEANLLAKQSAVLAAQAQLSLAQSALSHAQVRTAHTGLVQRKHANTGEYVQIGAPLFTLMDASKLQVVVSVPATEIDRVALGAECRLAIVGGTAGDVVGRIARVSPAADPGTRAFSVFIDVDNSNRRLRIGTFARGALSVGNDTPKALLPTTALRHEDGQDFVLTIEEGRLARRPVKVLRRDDAKSRAQIEPSFDPALPVLLVQHPELREGQAVTLLGKAP